MPFSDAAQSGPGSSTRSRAQETEPPVLAVMSLLLAGGATRPSGVRKKPSCSHLGPGCLIFEETTGCGAFSSTMARFSSQSAAHG